MSKVAGKKKTIRDKYDDPEIDRQLRALRTTDILRVGPVSPDTAT